MKFPNKVVSFQDSILSKFPVILEVLEKGDRTPADLYKKVSKKVESVGEFTSILDCLFALRKIELIDGEVIHYVKGN